MPRPTMDMGPSKGSRPARARHSPASSGPPAPAEHPRPHPSPSAAGAKAWAPVLPEAWESLLCWQEPPEEPDEVPPNAARARTSLRPLGRARAAGQGSTPAANPHLRRNASARRHTDIPLEWAPPKLTRERMLSLDEFPAFAAERTPVPAARASSSVVASPEPGRAPAPAAEDKTAVRKASVLPPPPPRNAASTVEHAANGAAAHDAAAGAGAAATDGDALGEGAVGGGAEGGLAWPPGPGMASRGQGCAAVAEAPVGASSIPATREEPSRSSAPGKAVGSPRSTGVQGHVAALRALMEEEGEGEGECSSPEEERLLLRMPTLRRGNDHLRRARSGSTGTCLAAGEKGTQLARCLSTIPEAQGKGLGSTQQEQQQCGQARAPSMLGQTQASGFTKKSLLEEPGPCVWGPQKSPRCKDMWLEVVPELSIGPPKITRTPRVSRDPHASAPLTPARPPALLKPAAPAMLPLQDSSSLPLSPQPRGLAYPEHSLRSALKGSKNKREMLEDRQSPFPDGLDGWTQGSTLHSTDSGLSLSRTSKGSPRSHLAPPVPTGHLAMLVGLAMVSDDVEERAEAGYCAEIEGEGNERRRHERSSKYMVSLDS